MRDLQPLIVVDQVIDHQYINIAGPVEVDPAYALPLTPQFSLYLARHRQEGTRGKRSTDGEHLIEKLMLALKAHRLRLHRRGDSKDLPHPLTDQPCGLGEVVGAIPQVAPKSDISGALHRCQIMSIASP